jgi:hypothetical protein
MKIPLVGQAYTSRSLAISAQECINLYPEKTESDGRSMAALHGTPGHTMFVMTGSGPIRGMHVMNEILYVVTGTSLYSVTTIGTVTLLGSIPGDNRVSMAHNNAAQSSLGGNTLQQLCIVDGGDGYIYDTTNGLVIITDVNFNAADTVQFTDGYFLFNWKGTSKFFSSDINDGTNYIGTDFGETATGADNIVTILVDHKEIWLFGEQTIEVWYNALAPGFVFQQIEAAYIERGCGAIHSVVKIDNTVYWLAEDLIVYRAAGYNLERTSTHAIEFAIKGYDTTDDAFGFTYTDDGHKFYVLTFPTGSTWVFDTTTGMWHERRSQGMDRWRANAYAFFNNKHYIGDSVTNEIHELDLDTYTENGTEIIRSRTTTYVHAEANPAYLDWLQVIIESGTGLTTGQGSDPQIMMQYSDDGAKTWSNEKWRTMGKIGKYFRRVRWTQLGRFYQRVFRIMISDPIKVVLTEADIHISKGSR